MNTLNNIAISASAGSGKTYQLTNRFIYLLHLSEQPERIIALTFTRTAAGEFFHKIVEKLCNAAESQTLAESLSKELGIQADHLRYRHLLELVIHSMHRLNLQTLDSFFFRVVSSFALELGLSGNLKLLDETSEPRIRNAVRDRIVYSSNQIDEALNEFWHAFKQATYGREERSIDRIIAGFIDSLYSLYLENPEPEKWGNPENIWANGCPWKTSSNIDWAHLAETFRNRFPDTLTKQQSKVFHTAANKIQNYGSDEDMKSSLLENAFAAADDIFSGQATIKVYKEIHLGPALCEALADCMRAIVWHHLLRALQNTQGVYRILQAYHESYDTLVRRPGMLAFSDLTHLLSSVEQNAPTADKALLDYRLDAKFDHWLFDEFQDTSRPQWQIVANLIDEIIQDSSGERSFFYVGDTKQCLYLWRNSDDRLFHEIQTHYNQNRIRIEPRPLSVSWRSCPAILNAVNAVFSDHLSITETFGIDAAMRWQRAWQPHQASPSTEKLSGYTCWLKAEKDESADRNALILRLLQDLNPLDRGISVGILVRKNADANEIADYLREHSSLPVHTGSDILPAQDNSAGAALLALIRLAAHPGDRLAAGYLQLIDQSSDGPSLLDASSQFRLRFNLEPADSAVRWACSQIAEKLDSDDHRHRSRLERLIASTRAFSMEEHQDLDSLYQFLRDSKSGECEQKDTIIIETIHKSKGLEYDTVILACEDKSTRSERQISALREANGAAKWILEPIKKELMLADSELAEFVSQTESQNGFGRLCTQYVAMTRAKRALYMISDFDRVSKGTTVDFLRTQLGDESKELPLFGEANRPYPILWQTGEADWYQHFESPKPSSASPEKGIDIESFMSTHERLHLSRPSSEKSRPLPAPQFFELENQATIFGNRIHNAFQGIEWLHDEIDYDAISKNEPRVRETLRACFQHPDIARYFTRTESAEVWRERAFTYVEGNDYVSGIFDRVTVHRSPDGHITRAEIIDFKTDQIRKDYTLEDATEEHRPQLMRYREALSRIIQLPTEHIQVSLLFTNVPQLVHLQ